MPSDGALRCLHCGRRPRPRRGARPETTLLRYVHFRLGELQTFLARDERYVRVRLEQLRTDVGRFLGGRSTTPQAMAPVRPLRPGSA
jgi:hypothetical protein